MSREANKSLKRLVCVGVIGLVVLAGTREARAETIFENIPVTTAPGDQSYPAIWGNYIVWKGAENEAYNIDEVKIVEMPGLNIDGFPAIWDNKVVWSDANGYYDIDLQQMVYPDGLSVGEWPAIHNNKVVWSDSTGYYDLDLGQMIYPPGLSIGHDPDIFGDKIVWGLYTDYYYDIGLQEMVYPEGLFIYGCPAIYGTKIVSSRSSGYYDLDLQQYIFVRVNLGEEPDIFEDSIVGHNYDAVPPITVDVRIWDPVCKQRWVTQSGCAYDPKIYNDIVVWMDGRNENADIYMARIVGCCGDPNHPYPVGDLNHDCRVNLLDLAILASHWLECTAPECETIVEVSVATDESTYLLGEEVTVFVTAYNPNPEPVTLTFRSDLQASYLMDGVFDWAEGRDALGVITYVTIESHDSHTWNLSHGSGEMETYPLDVGIHTVVGEVLGYGYSAPVEFEVDSE